MVADRRFSFITLIEHFLARSCEAITCTACAISWKQASPSFYWIYNQAKLRKKEQSIWRTTAKKSKDLILCHIHTPIFMWMPRLGRFGNICSTFTFSSLLADNWIILPSLWVFSWPVHRELWSWNGWRHRNKQIWHWKNLYHSSTSVISHLHANNVHFETAISIRKISMTDALWNAFASNAGTSSINVLLAHEIFCRTNGFAISE